MQKINLHNYEAWMLDAAEGQLSAEELEALRVFLALHPELDVADLDALPKLDPESVSFSHTLLKDETVCIEYVEGLLNPAQQKAVETDTSLTHTLQLYKATRISPELAIVYPNKKNILKQPKVVALFQPKIFRAAAAILIFAGLLWLIPDHTTVSVPNLTLAIQNPGISTPKKNTLLPAKLASTPVLAQNHANATAIYNAKKASSLIVPKGAISSPSIQASNYQNQVASKDSLQQPMPIKEQDVINSNPLINSSLIATQAPVKESSTKLYTSIDEIGVDNEIEEEVPTNWNQYMVKKEKTRSKTIYGRILTVADNAIAAVKKTLHFDNQTRGYAFAVRDLKIEKH